MCCDCRGCRVRRAPRNRAKNRLKPMKTPQMQILREIECYLSAFAVVGLALRRLNSAQRVRGVAPSTNAAFSSRSSFRSELERGAHLRFESESDRPRPSDWPQSKSQFAHRGQTQRDSERSHTSRTESRHTTDLLIAIHRPSADSLPSQAASCFQKNKACKNCL